MIVVKDKYSFIVWIFGPVNTGVARTEIAIRIVGFLLRAYAKTCLANTPWPAVAMRRIHHPLLKDWMPALFPFADVSHGCKVLELRMPKKCLPMETPHVRQEPK